MGKKHDLEWSLNENEVENTLLHHEGSPLLFGVVEPATVLADLEDAKILDRLKAKGYHGFSAQRKTHVQHEARFLLLAQHEDDGGNHALFDIRTHTSRIDWNGSKVQVLFWDWLEFQDPGGEFKPGRQPLPGQDHPGLGVFRQCTRLMKRYVEQTGAGAIVAIPEYFHNAWLYSRSFCFYEPEYEGRFRALARDLMPSGLARASHAVHEGKVEDQNGEVFVWKPNQQVYPLSKDTEAHFATEAYKKTSEAFAESIRFRIQERQS